MGIKEAIAKGVAGVMGATPPPDAPKETTQPLQPDAGGIVVYDPVTQQPTGEVVTPAQRAAANEKPLAPFNPKRSTLTPEQINAQLKAMGLPPVQPATTLPVPPVATPAPPAEGSTEALISDVFGEDLPPDMQAPPVDPVAAILEPPPPLSEEDRARMPAASDTDTPSKGLLPTLTPPTGDKFEGIARGGFSSLDDGQYFPITGDELKTLVGQMLTALKDQIQNDLRFSMALTYPRLRATLELRVEGHVEDADSGFTINKVRGPKHTTPLEVARKRSKAVVFVLDEVRQEFTPAGEVDTPPDAMRADLGLVIPHKQLLQGERGEQSFVDLIPGDTAALTR